MRKNENGKIAAVVATALLGAALLLAPLRFPREAAAGVCAQCSTSNCCEDSCSGNEICSGSTRYGCYCKCSPSCSCASSTCTGSTCSDGCGGTCNGTKNCSTPPPEKCAQCNQTNCCDDNCYYYAPARTCVGNRMSGCYCKAASTPTSTPTATPTPTPQACVPSLSECDDGQDVCGDEAGEGDTCIHLYGEDEGTCVCTSEQPTGGYVCAPYRDPQIVDGVCYQQWECCDPITGTCLYQIRHDCVGGSATPAPTATPTPTPSCAVSLSPSSATVSEGNYVSFRASVTPANGTVARVEFSPSSSLASVAPLSDGTVPYDVSARGISAGTTGVVAKAVMAGSVRCSATSTLVVAEPGPWWQTRDADVTANGNLTSLIPFGCSLPACDPAFGLEGSGGFPGIPSYVGTMSLGSGSVSPTGWAAESAPGSRRAYTYASFARRIPSDVESTEISSGSVAGSMFGSGGTPSHGAYWYRYDGSSGIDLTVSGDADLGSRKVILMVANSDLYLNGKISLTDGEGLFAAIVGEDGNGNKGNIIVDPAVGGSADGVPELEGLFVADSEFKTGAGSSQLHVRGSVAGLSGILLQRDLDDDSQTPAEYFEYAPDLILNIPSSLKTSRYSWREVAP